MAVEIENFVVAWVFCDFENLRWKGQGVESVTPGAFTFRITLQNRRGIDNDGTDIFDTGSLYFRIIGNNGPNPCSAYVTMLDDGSEFLVLAQQGGGLITPESVSVMFLTGATDSPQNALV